MEIILTLHEGREGIWKTESIDAHLFKEDKGKSPSKFRSDLDGFWDGIRSRKSRDQRVYSRKYLSMIVCEVLRNVSGNGEYPSTGFGDMIF